MRKTWIVLLWFLVLGMARADVTLLVEEPYGHFGGLTPTGHAAVYFSRVCAETPVVVRRCRAGEIGAVISRYHRVGGYDWIAIPLTPYLYAVDRLDEVPVFATAQQAALLRDRYRRAHLEALAADQPTGDAPRGDWTQLAGEAYDRSIYTFQLKSTEAQDDAFIAFLNSRPNRVRFHLLSENCADFARQVINFYYPHSIHRDFAADMGVMTPKQAARCVVRYCRKHADLPVFSFVIEQVPGTLPRSRPVRGVLETFIKSKRYAAPLAPLALLHPALLGGVAYTWLESHFDPKRIAHADGGLVVIPETVVDDLRPAGEALRVP